jgi:CheY-like chemotaxis protein
MPRGGDKVERQHGGSNDRTQHADAPLALVVDDVALNRTLLAELISIAGYRVIEAADGRQALEKIELFHPDLVFMDIEMPVMTGIAAVRELRKNSLYRSLPVIAVSALSSEAARRSAIEAGFSAYIIKPCSAKDLINVARQLSGGTDRDRPGDTGEGED